MLRSRPHDPASNRATAKTATPIELGDLFRLLENPRKARATLFTHQLGWELRLLVGSQLEVVQAQVCRDREEVSTTGKRWKAALVEKGWR